MLSIIIPIFNTELYLSNCIDSILSQGYKDYEVILIDDGSTDRCGEICNGYSDRYNNVFTYHIVNQGVSNARNEGLKRASGEYIIFIDSDDEISNEYLKNIVSNNMEYVDLEIHDAKVMNEKKEILASIGPDINELLDYNKIKNLLLSMDAKKKQWVLEYVWNKVYSKKIIDTYDIKFDVSKNLGEDFMFNCKYFEKIESIIMLSNNPYYYFIRNNTTSLTKKFRLNELERRKIMHNTIFQLYEKWNILEEKKNDIKEIEGLYGLRSINSIFLKDCTLNFKNKQRFMKEFLDTEYYEFILLYYKNNTNFKNWIWKFLIIRKMNFIYIILYWLINSKKLQVKR